MGRPQRTDVGGYVYHILNRANARMTIFDTDKEYQNFEQILFGAVEKYKMRLVPTYRFSATNLQPLYPPCS